MAFGFKVNTFLILLELVTITFTDAYEFNQGLVAYPDRHGVIQSYNFPFKYQDNLYQYYQIYPSTTDKVEGTICFRFQRFETKANEDYLTFIQGFAHYSYHGNGICDTDSTSVWDDPFCWQTENGKLDIQFQIGFDQRHLPGFYATFWLETSNVKTIKQSKKTKAMHIPTEAPCDHLHQWTCFNRNCILANKTCDTINDCGDWSDEAYGHTGCTKGPYGPSLYACDFIDPCDMIGFGSRGWQPEKRSDNNDRGPHQDHTQAETYSNYVRTQFGTSSEGHYQVGLTAPVWIYPNNSYCLSFWYHMMGPRVGRLTVYLGSEQRYDRPLWSRTANYSNRWLHGEINLTNMPENGPYGLVYFEGERSYDSEAVIALDDISLQSDRSCGVDDISCNFEHSLCGWVDVENLFIKNSGQLPPTGPNADPVSEDGDEFYLATWSDGNKFTSALESPVYGRSDSSGANYVACVQIWLYLSETFGGVFEISTVGIDGSRKNHTRVQPNISPGEDSDDVEIPPQFRHPYVNYATSWPEEEDWEARTWKEFLFEVNHNVPFKIRIEANSYGHDYENVEIKFALDEVVVVEGWCDNVELQSCRRDEYRCDNGHCIDMNKVCDRVQDCSDGSDEDPPACCYKNNCDPGEFCCKNGHCIIDGYFCDGANNCGDWSDEDDCPAGCAPGMFECEDGSRCIQERYTCDNHGDCLDNSDEYDCVTYLPPGAIAGIVVVVALVLILVLVRVAFWSRSKPRCCRAPYCSCCCCVDDSESTTTTGDDTDRLPDPVHNLYQQPPEYEEVMSSQIYKRTVSQTSSKMGSTDNVNVVPPPSYDRVEKGEFETIVNVKESAVERLRRAMMAKSRDRLDSKANSSVSTIDTSIYSIHNASTANQETVVEINPVSRNPNPEVTRTPSNVSASTIPRYSALVHPPAYDNLSFRDDNDVMLNDTLTRAENMPDVVLASTAADPENTVHPTRSSPGSPVAVHTGTPSSLYRTESKRLKKQIQRRGARRGPTTPRTSSQAQDSEPAMPNTLPRYARQNTNTSSHSSLAHRRESLHSVHTPTEEQPSISLVQSRSMARSMPCLVQSSSREQFSLADPVSSTGIILTPQSLAQTQRLAKSQQHLGSTSEDVSFIRRAKSQATLSLNCRESVV